VQPDQLYVSLSGGSELDDEFERREERMVALAVRTD